MKGARRGAIYKITLGTKHSYAVALHPPLFAFFDVLTDVEMSPSEIEEKELLFSVWVMAYAVRKGGWVKVGFTDKFDATPEARFFKQDLISGRLTAYRDADGHESPIDFDTAAKMEAAAVWDPEHIEDRLRDHFAGRPNKWVESLRPRRS